MITSTLIALTLSVTPTHTGWERTVPEVHVVQPGESLSSVDTSEGSPGPWTRLGWVNRDLFTDPNVIDVGTVLRIPHADGRRLQWTPPPLTSASSSSQQPSSSAASSGSSSGGSANPYVDPWGCEAETAQDWSPSGTYWGKYQFDRATWLAHGGDPSDYGSAPEAEQDAVAARVDYDAWPSC